MRARRAALLVTGAVLLAGCELPNFGAPDAASEQGERTLSLWRGTVVAALVVGAIVWVLLGYVLVRFRRRGDPDTIPHQKGHNLALEIVYTAIPVAIVAVLFTAAVMAQHHVDDLPDREDLRVEVLGFQWQWQFRYVEAGVVVTGVAGEPDPVLVLPVDRTTVLDLVADDVVHSFWVPHFLTKRDLIPGIDNEIAITPTRTGEYTGECAEYCGIDHWRMRFAVRVVEADEFDEWLATAQQEATVG
jgi:cytochrome c oxidase subunit 2